MLQMLRFRAPGKANLPRTFGRHCRDLVPTFRAGCFLKSTVPAFSSFSELWTPVCENLQFSAKICGFLHPPIGSRPGKPNQRKGQNEKFMNFAHFCEFWCFSLGNQARFTSNFCSECPREKFMNWPFFGLVCRGDLIQTLELPRKE